MKVSELIRQLKVLPEDMEVFVRTEPSDYFSPLTIENMQVDQFLNGDPACLLITAFIPMEKDQ